MCPCYILLGWNVLHKHNLLWSLSTCQGARTNAGFNQIVLQQKGTAYPSFWFNMFHLSVVLIQATNAKCLWWRAVIQCCAPHNAFFNNTLWKCIYPFRTTHIVQTWKCLDFKTLIQKITTWEGSNLLMVHCLQRGKWEWECVREQMRVCKRASESV